MSVHYKFKSALDYDTVTFDGLHISVGDLKAAISQQKRIGKTSDFDLEITNAQTKEVYVDDNALIPKNTSLLVARVPLSQQPKKQWDGSNSNQTSLHKDVAPNKGLADLSRMEGSEQDKINAMISQSTFDYDPSNYQKIRGQNQRGLVPSNYICYKCQKRGHWIKDCPAAISGDPIEIRRSTGIPRSFMVPVEGPKAPGAMMTPSGTFAVPAVDREAYLASENAGGADTPTNAPAAPEPNIPDELICSLCRDLLTDAVMIPCCGNSFCDECIRGALLESEDRECPDCREKEIAPTTLIPNRFLRNSVSSFRNQTGYSRRMPHRPAAAPVQQHPPMLGEPVNAQVQPPPNGPMQPGSSSCGRIGASGASASSGIAGEESDGSADDNITLTLPAAHRAPARPQPIHSDHHRHPRYGPSGLKPPGIETPPNPVNMPRVDEQRASTPTIDERRDPMSSQVLYNRGPPPFIPGVPPPNRRYNAPFGRTMGPGGPRPYSERYPPEPYQPPPPGIKDSPTNGHGEDPLEAFNRMIREKEMRAKRREEERRRAQSGSRSTRSRTPRSPRSPRSQRSPRSPRSPRSVRSPRSPRQPRSPRSPRPPRSPRSPHSPRSPRSPRARPRSRGSSRLRYSRSRSVSRSRLRRSPWSPRRRRTRERTLSLTRSPSPRRRHRSPMRYRTPLRSPMARSPLRSPLRSPVRSPLRSPPPRSPMRSPMRPAMRSPPPPRNISPHRYAGVYDELLSPPRRSVEPPYGARYGLRSGAPPQGYPQMGVKQMPPVGNIPVQPEQPPGYRGRYDAPSFEEIPPGVEPPVPGFEPSPFEKPPFGQPGPIDRDRLPLPNYRDPYRPPQYGEGLPGYRDMPIPPPVQSEIPVHVGEQPPRYRDNYRTGHYRDQGPMPFRDGQAYREPGPQGPYREPNFRGGPPPFRDNSYRNVPYRDGGFRDNTPHNSFRDPGVPFRPPTADPREAVPPNYHDPNYRDNYRDENGATRDHSRPGYRTNVRNRGGPRRNTNIDHDRHREREGRDRERYNENREPVDKAERTRDSDRRIGYDKSRDTREGREDRPRDYDRNYDKERDLDRATPDKKTRTSPKRNRETREKKRSESRGRSRERDSRREKKEDRGREKSSADRSRDHKDKEKKLKERKKKKREKEKDAEKKKKREKKDKKDKDHIKKEDDDPDKGEVNIDEKDTDKVDTEKKNMIKIEKNNIEEVMIDKEDFPKVEAVEKPLDDLYGDEAVGAVDKEIIENYIKTEDKDVSMREEAKSSENINNSKEEPFDGIELQANADELDLKVEIEASNPTNKEMLATLPELSKWEVDEDNIEKAKEPGEITSPEEEEDGGKVTSDVIKRAENAIFAKAINSLRPIEIKKISSDRLKLYGDEVPKTSMNNIQITVPVTDSEQRSIEINERKRRYSKTPPPRLSVKDRLGGKVEDVRRGREARVVQSTVERVKSRSKTPKRDQPYRRVTVERERGRKQDTIRAELSKGDRRVMSEAVKTGEKHQTRSPNEKKYAEKSIKEDKKSVHENNASRNRGQEKNASGDIKSSHPDRERKKSTLDEAHFEPDYDETVESDHENKEDIIKKRERSASPESKKAKLDNETIKLDLTNVKKKPDSESESSSDSEYSSSSSSSDARKRKKKKKRSKKKKKRAASDSDSESESSSDDHKKKKKKRKHKKKSSKKKKKSKHK